MPNTRILLALLRAIACGFLLSLITLSTARVLLIQWLGPDSGLPFYDYPDVNAALWVGLRFDLKHLAVTLGPWLIITLAIWKASERFWRNYYRIFSIYLFTVLLAINLLSIVNYYYYTFYQSPINVLIFGLHEDDTSAVLQTLWSDFPVVRLLLFIISVTAIQGYLCHKVATRSLSPNHRQSTRATAVAISVVSVVLLALLSRGSLGKFPLRTMHMAVSSSSFINSAVASGPHALLLAAKDRSHNQIHGDPYHLLNALGFNSEAEAYQVCHATELPDLPRARTHKQLPPNPYAEAHPPHVVVAVMESWGNHLMAFDSEKSNDLLGALRPWVNGKADYFPNALSIQNGTHPSLEGLLIDTPITPLTQGVYGYTQYPSARAQPYKDAGYKTVFLTAGSKLWRKLDPALLTQGFDVILDQADILQRYPHATNSTWGLDDEWMFKYAADLLAEADSNNEKLMLVMLSITNHPPYQIPKHYETAVLDIDALGETLATDNATGLSILETYQYANHALGEFLNQLEQRALLDRTLFAATGDHASRSITRHASNEQLNLKYGVPILFFIPEPYRLSDTTPALQQWTSHQDIFPTLWQHSLFNTDVPLQGRNIYQEAPAEQAFSFSFIGEDGGPGITLSQQGAVTNMLNPHYYTWTEANTLVRTDTPSPQLIAQGLIARGCLALRDWSIRQKALQ